MTGRTKQERKRNISLYLPDDICDYLDQLAYNDPAERGRGAIVAEIIRKDMKKIKSKGIAR